MNHTSIIKYKINQHSSNLKKSHKKWFDPLISQTERSMSRDPDEYRYKCSNGSKSFEKYLEYFISKQENHCHVTFNRLPTNQYLIDWPEAIDICLNHFLSLYPSHFSSCPSYLDKSCN